MNPNSFSQKWEMNRIRKNGMAKKDVKTNLLNHSEAKVRILGEYLKRYLNIISNDGYTQLIKIFDLFCGEGIYENGG